MNYKVILMMMLVGSFGCALVLHQIPVYNRVSTSNHHSIEKAMHDVGIMYSNNQLERMYEELK